MATRKVQATPEFLVKQKNVLRLLWRVQEPNTYTELVDIGKSYRFEDDIESYKVNYCSYSTVAYIFFLVFIFYIKSSCHFTYFPRITFILFILIKFNITFGDISLNLY